MLGISIHTYVIEQEGFLFGITCENAFLIIVIAFCDPTEIL